jgi:single-stranded-DNA-specific exonuclease
VKEKKMKRWMQKRSKVNYQKMAQALNIQEATACVLANRGIFTREAAVQFLSRKPIANADTSKMKGFTKALSMVSDAIRLQKKIMIYGDYDVDGVMSTTILFQVMKKCGAQVAYYIPHRQKEGYGLNQEVIRKFKAEGIQLLITCDNGIAAIEEIALAKENQMEVLVIDHHEPAFVQMKEDEYQDILPEADAIIDPKQRECEYPFSLFCAAGLSYKFACALMKQQGVFHRDTQKEYLVLASIATVCDIVDLIGENRVIVSGGIRYSNASGNIGLNALIEEAGLLGKSLNEYHFGFVLGPCINAAGRLERADTAVRLFCETDEIAAKQIAKKVVELNQSRKEMTKQATENVLLQINSGEYQEDKVLVLYREDIHESIAGIVAGRIKEECYRPVVMITGGEQMAKGSARSIEGYNIFEALLSCRDILQRFGGHAMAAGLSMYHEDIPLLRKRLNESCQLTKEDMTPVIRIEKQLSFAEIGVTLAQELEGLAPFGKGNQIPLFGSKNILVERFYILGKENNILRMELVEEETQIRHTAISFDGFDLFCNFIKQLYPNKDYDKILKGNVCPMYIDIVYSIDINRYQGRNMVQLLLKDFRLAKHKENSHGFKNKN